MPRIDLHLHTTFSDGSFTPHQVLTMAHHAGLSTIAITDHDTTDGLPEALSRAPALNLQIIPGIEISSCFRKLETHILGYFIAWQDPTLQHRLIGMRESRCTRISKIISKLTQLGLPLTEGEVSEVAGVGSTGRPHIAQVILAKGYVTSVKEAFKRYLGQGAEAFVPRDLPNAAEVISWIREVGGVAVLAHPSWVEDKREGLQPFCEALKECGLHGLEVFYSSHTPKQVSEYLTLAKKLDLLVTGGSDFHGSVKPEVRIGVGRGNLKVSAKLLGPLEAARNIK